MPIIGCGFPLFISFFCFKTRFGPNSFQQVLRAINTKTESESVNVDWRDFKYMVFDLPISDKIYAERYVDLGNFIFILFVYLFLSCRELL